MALVYRASAIYVICKWHLRGWHAALADNSFSTIDSIISVLLIVYTQ